MEIIPNGGSRKSLADRASEQSLMFRVALQCLADCSEPRVFLTERVVSGRIVGVIAILNGVNNATALFL
jgi:hypothetical protein